MPRQILLHLNTCGDQHLISLPYAHQPLIKVPVAKPTKRHAVHRAVVMGLTPGDNMGRLDHGVPFRREHADAAKRATVVVKSDNGLSKALIPDLITLLFTLLPVSGLRVRDQPLTVLLGLVVCVALLKEDRAHLGSEVGLKQNGT